VRQGIHFKSLTGFVPSVGPGDCLTRAVVTLATEPEIEAPAGCPGPGDPGSTTTNRHPTLTKESSPTLTRLASNPQCLTRVTLAPMRGLVSRSRLRRTKAEKAKNVGKLAIPRLPPTGRDRWIFAVCLVLDYLDRLRQRQHGPGLLS
jgi:hypothetical protein